METLKETRKKLGIKMYAAADAIGVSRQTYRGYERHPEKMSVEKAQKLCDFMHVPIDNIFFGQSDK